nr:MAG TPA: hypothetical protein [Caudoviricetes sp.]
MLFANETRTFAIMFVFPFIYMVFFNVEYLPIYGER